MMPDFFPTTADRSYATRLFCPILLPDPIDRRDKLQGDNPATMRIYRERVERQLRSGPGQPITTLQPTLFERAMHQP